MKIGILGAGVMGQGVAHRFAANEYEVFLLDIEEDILEEALNKIKRNLFLEKMAGKNPIDVNEIINRIHITTSYEDLKDADFIVENVPEIVDLKKQVYEKLETVCNQKCIYLVNTSCISITQIGGYTGRSERVIGVHFMNPVPMKNFAEVIKGQKTSEKTIEQTCLLLKGVGIDCEIIQDSCGFVSNRLSHLFMNEAAFLVYEGVADSRQIDNIFKRAFGHTMGPLETADLIGLDTVLNSLNVLYDHYGSSKFMSCPLLKEMVSTGSLGRKTKKGFYEYQ